MRETPRDRQRDRKREIGTDKRSDADSQTRQREIQTESDRLRGTLTDINRYTNRSEMRTEESQKS